MKIRFNKFYSLFYCIYRNSCYNRRIVTFWETKIEMEITIMIYKKPMVQEKEQHSLLKIVLITAAVVIAAIAALAILYNFFKKHFKISFEYDCDGNCSKADGYDFEDDELFSDCEFCASGDGMYVPEADEIEIEEFESGDEISEDE